MTSSLRSVPRAAILVFALSAAAPALTAFAQTTSTDAHDVTGYWEVGDRTAIVQVAPCGAALCGRIVHLADDHGVRDDRNLDRNLRSREVSGLTILTSLRPAVDGRLASGRLYDPESDQTLSGVSLERRGDRLRVSIGSGLFASDETWRPVAAPRTACAGG